MAQIIHQKKRRLRSMTNVALPVARKNEWCGENLVSFSSVNPHGSGISTSSSWMNVLNFSNHTDLREQMAGTLKSMKTQTAGL